MKAFKAFDIEFDIHHCNHSGRAILRTVLRGKVRALAGRKHQLSLSLSLSPWFV